MMQPRATCTVQRVCRNSRFSKFLELTASCCSPRSETIARPWMIAIDKAIRPNISGASRRVITRLLPSRSTIEMA